MLLNLLYCLGIGDIRKKKGPTLTRFCVVSLIYEFELCKTSRSLEMSYATQKYARIISENNTQHILTIAILAKRYQSERLNVKRKKIILPTFVYIRIYIYI